MYTGCESLQQGNRKTRSWEESIPREIAISNIYILKSKCQ